MSSPRLIATAVASYFVFGHAMYVILQEMEWFTRMRHRFLMQKKVRNYSVYIRNIPQDWRSNRGLKNFFEKSIKGITVLESHIRLSTQNLKAKVGKRDEIIGHLERAVAMEDEFGVRPWRRAWFQYQR